MAMRTSWPSDTRGSQVGIVVTSYNTQRLVAQLVFSLYRLLGADEFAELVVIDNASTDGSREILEALHQAGFIHLIQNRRQHYHGPALTQGVSWLARRQRDAEPTERLGFVWVLDSDVVVLRPDTVRAALDVLEASDAAAVGQPTGDRAYDRLLTRNPEMLQPCSFLFDPALIWQEPIPPFVEDGAPATALQIGADEAGLRLVAFPFVEGGYILHLGRGTLREVAHAGDSTNRYFDWARDHSDYHFAGHPEGARLYRDFCALFEAEVGEPTPERLVAALAQ
jgi:glycosyltransferase involved in cell wall biosynthesis